MASLTRNDWLEMWASISAIELNNKDIRSIAHFLGPYRKGQMRGICKGNEIEIRNIKRLIESVIGQME